MKIGLGTVQFGLDYGVSNRGGKTPIDEAKRIIDTASKGGVRVIDTAALYGASEEVLGSVLPVGHSFDVITKTIKFGGDVIRPDDPSLLEQAFEASLARLKASFVYGLLIHDADDLLKEGGKILFEKMESFKKAGLVKKTGASVYTGEQIDRLLADFPIDMIQLPINVLDQRLIRSGHLSRLASAGVEVHARSAFLQGLLLMDPDAVPSFFGPIRKDLERYHGYLKMNNISPVEGSIGFVTGLKEIDAVVCGVETSRQLADILRAAPLRSSELSSFAISDERMLNPARWTI